MAARPGAAGGPGGPVPRPQGSCGGGSSASLRLAPPPPAPRAKTEEAAAAMLSTAAAAEAPSSGRRTAETSAVLCSGGCALLAFSSLLAVVVLFLPSGQCERRLCSLACYMQMAAVFIMGFGLLVYPFGLGAAAVRRYCEDSSIYYAGDCQIGWGYMLAIVGVMLSVFLPFFAKYAPKEHASPTPIPTIL